MRGDVCSELIQHLDDGTLECGHAPQDVKDWLESLNLPMELLRFMQWRWPQQDCQIAHLSILSSRSIKDDDFAEPLAKAGFLLIGSAPNGDWLVIAFAKLGCIPGFITHEEWDQESSPASFFEPIAKSMESLLYRIAEGRYIPTDYYAAKPFNDFLREENGA
jgi:hypothetical protein